MAACSPSDLLNANPFVGLSAGQKLAAECELVRQWAGSSETVSQILARAWDFKNLSEGTALAVEAGLLAEIAGESNPYVLLQNNGFVSLDSGLVWSAKLARLQELAGHSGDIDSLFLNNHFESIDQGLAMSAKLRLLCDLAYGTGSGSATQALTANAFWVMGEGLTKACINELLCLSSSSATIETIVTQSSVTPSETLSVSGGYDSVRVWTGETPVTEPWFFLYVTRSGVTSKIKMNRFEARVVNVPGGSIGFGTSDGRTIYVAKDVKDSAHPSLFLALPMPTVLECLFGLLPPPTSRFLPESGNTSWSVPALSALSSSASTTARRGALRGGCVFRQAARSVCTPRSARLLWPTTTAPP